MLINSEESVSEENILENKKKESHNFDKIKKTSKKKL